MAYFIPSEAEIEMIKRKCNIETVNNQRKRLWQKYCLSPECVRSAQLNTRCSSETSQLQSKWLICMTKFAVYLIAVIMN